MYIKPSTVLPPGTKITKIPAGEFRGKSVYTLQMRHEKTLAELYGRREEAKLKGDAKAVEVFTKAIQK